MESWIAKVLFTYWIAPQGNTGSSPAEFLIGRIPRTRLDLIFPNPTERVEEKQSQQKSRHDTTAHNRPFTNGEAVLVLNFPSEKGLIQGKILKSVGLVSYLIKLIDG